MAVVIFFYKNVSDLPRILFASSFKVFVSNVKILGINHFTILLCWLCFKLLTIFLTILVNTSTPIAKRTEADYPKLKQCNE